jgi:lipoprotein-releasing system permease protein
MMIGVMALIIVVSVMNGFNSEMQRRVGKVFPDARLYFNHPAVDTIEIERFLQTEPEISNYSAAIEKFGLLRAGERSQMSRVVGIDPESDSAVVDLEESLIAGSVRQLQSGSFNVVVGDVAARQLGLFIGDRVDLILPKFTITPAGLFPRTRSFNVVGIYRSGSPLDNELGFVQIDDLRRLAALPEASIELYRLSSSSGNVDQLLSLLQNRIEILFPQKGLSVESGASGLATLFQAMQMEKLVVSLMLCAIILVAAFNIVSGLTLMVADKRSDIAIIRTCGASAGDVMKIFVIQGLVIGGIGIILGALLGTLVATNMGAIIHYIQNLSASQLFDPSVFYIVEMPSEWRSADFLLIIGTAFLLTFLATLFPAWRASQISPVESLAYQH